MEYAAMLGSPELVSGLRDLLSDGDVAVVKRTVRVFANVYRHALQLLAAGDLDEATFTAAWPAVRGVAEHVMGLLATTENEGITVHVVRFLEAALVAHLLCDVSRFPEVAAHTPKMVAKGVAALTGLISTPYVGGSAFLVAVRALITVACYKHDLWTSVTNLIERQIASPPPTLFDHNVRSLHKILQRNLFRLLRRADSAALRSQLIEMMVTVGVPRRMLAQWAPPAEARKRPAQPQSEDAITGRNTPPNKRPRSDADNEATTGPRDPREGRPPRDPREPRDPRDPRMNGHHRDPRDPRTTPRSDPRLSPPQDPRVAAPGHDPALAKSSSRPNSPPTSGSPPPVAQVPPATAAQAPSSSPPPSTKETISNFEFLKSLITTKKQASTSFLEKCSEKERALYERLDHPSVVRLVLSCLDSVPDSPPEDLLRKLGRASGDVTGIREQLTSLLAPHIHADFISSLNEDEANAPPSRPSSTSSSAFSARVSPPHSEASAPSPPSSARSTPSDPAQVCHSDVDLRHLLNRGFHATGDVDMRDTRHLLPGNPQPPPPVNHRGASRRTDPRKPFPTSTRLDPRIAMPEPIETPGGSGSGSGVGGLDPRITQAYSDSQEVMLGRRGGPFMEGMGPPFMGGPHPQPSPGYMGGGPQGYTEGARPPFLEGSSGMMGMRHGFDMPTYEGQYSRPAMGGPLGGPPHDGSYMGPRGMMGAGPRGMGGPWQDGGVPHHGRMGVMMPVMNGGSAMFSPPMHL